RRPPEPRAAHVGGGAGVSIEPPNGVGRASLHEVETQRDDLLVYLSAARAILDVCAGTHGMRGTAQELGAALGRGLGVQAGAITVRDSADEALRLRGFANQ